MPRRSRSTLRRTCSFVEGANRVRYAYRRFGTDSGTPLVFLQHFRGDLDNGDPAVGR
jgi:hypothetical protein